MTLRDTLDAAAEQAMTGRRLDATAALVRGRARARARRGMLALAAAAAVVLLALLGPLAPGLPDGPVVPAAPTGSPVGLPERLFKPPPWTPSVTDRPIAAAGVALLDERGNGYVVSADGRDYRRLPNGPAELEQRFVVLSPDGTGVAWGGARISAAGAPASGPSVVRLLRLGRGGPAAEISLPDAGLGSGIRQLAWSGDGHALYVTGEVVTERTGGNSFRFDVRVWRLVEDANGTWSAAEACRSCETAITTRADGTLEQADPGTVPPLDPHGVTWRTNTPRDWALPSYGQTFLVAPHGGRAVAWVTSNTSPPPDWTLAVFTGSGSDPAAAGVRHLKLTSSDGVPDAGLLAWTDQGVLVRFARVDPASDRTEVTLERVDPDDGTRHVVTRTSLDGNGWVMPMSVSTLAAASPTVVPGVRPSTSPWTPAALRYELLTIYGGWFRIGAIALLGVVLVMWARRRRSARAGR